MPTNTIHEVAATNDYSPDILSRLPVELFDHIISLLTPKELIATRILARKWMESQVLHFCIHSDQEFQEYLKSIPKHEGKKKSVSINLQYHSNDSEKFIGEFISFAAKNNVYELSLNCPNCKLPQTTFDCASLIVLRLEDCLLNYLPKVMNWRLDSLQVLSLSDVSFSASDFAKLTLASPNISHLSLKHCRVVALAVGFDLRNLKKLKNVEVCGSSYRGIATDSPELCFVDVTCGREKACRIYLERSTKLEILKLKTKFLPRLAMEDFFTNCPLLECVHELCTSSVRRPSCSSNITIFVDMSSNATSNKFCFEYARLGFRPFKFSVKSKSQWKARFQAEYTVSINTYCFMKLRELTECLAPNNVLSFRFHGKLLKEGINIGELKNSYESPVCYIKHLKLDFTSAGLFPLRYSKVLIDAFLWSCFPETLTFKLSKHQKVFMKALSEKFTFRGERSKKCCKATDEKCWRHFLKDVEIERNSITDKQGTEYERVDIKFQWLKP